MCYTLHAHHHLICSSFGWFIGLFSNKSTNLLFSDIPLLHYYINLRSLIISCLFLKIKIFFRISIDFSVCKSTSESFWGKFFIIVSAILVSIKSPFASAVFWIILFSVVLSASIADFLVWSKCFWLYLSVTSLVIFITFYKHLLL